MPVSSAVVRPDRCRVMERVRRALLLTPMSVSKLAPSRISDSDSSSCRYLQSSRRRVPFGAPSGPAAITLQVGIMPRINHMLACLCRRGLTCWLLHSWAAVYFLYLKPV